MIKLGLLVLDWLWSTLWNINKNSLNYIETI